MTSGMFDANDWMERVAATLGPLAKAQEPYLHAYWQHHPREQVIVNGRNETPFPSGRSPHGLRPGALQPELRERG